MGSKLERSETGLSQYGNVGIDLFSMDFGGCFIVSGRICVVDKGKRCADFKKTAKKGKEN